MVMMFCVYFTIASPVVQAVYGRTELAVPQIIYLLSAVVLGHHRPVIAQTTLLCHVQVAIVDINLVQPACSPDH